MASVSWKLPEILQHDKFEQAFQAKRRQSKRGILVKDFTKGNYRKSNFYTMVKMSYECGKKELCFRKLKRTIVRR